MTGPAAPVVSAGEFLNSVVQALYARTRLPQGQRPERLGRLLVVESSRDAARILDEPELFAKNFALVAAFGPSRFNQNGAAWAALRPRTQRAYARAGRPVMLTEISAIYAAELAPATPDAPGIEAALARAALRIFFAAFDLRPDVTPFLAHFAALRQVVSDLQHMSWQGMGALDVDAIRARATAPLQSFTAACADQPAVMATVTRLAGLRPVIPVDAMMADFMTNMFAGIETTTASLAWMIDAMGRSAKVQDALRAEARDPSGEGALLQSFRDECLRMFSPIPFVVREVTADTRLGRHDLARRDLVLLSLVGLHRDPDSWTDPLAFHAARAEFAPGAPPNPAFRPFLSGPRVCGGRRIAEMELTAALRLLVSGFRFESPAADPAFSYALAFRPRFTSGHRVSRL
ncbi:MAG: cytochrome P450 [Rhodobacterales bacterium]|nr:cytochrome P450 [Rhodobacterales bacterium]